MPVFAQADQARDDIYEIRPKDGSDAYFAWITNKGSDRLSIEIYYKPGSNTGDKLTVKKSEVEFDLLGKSLADREIERRLNQTSTMVNGVRVLNDELQRSKQARAWAGDLEKSVTMPDPDPADVAAADVPPEDPGPLAFRGPQIALVLGALALIGIIVKLLILG
jgi:hypothetical protein